MVRPFSFDRGIDIGGGASGNAVIAPAGGVVSFAGTTPGNGVTLSIKTAEGYTVTLTHLGSIDVRGGANVAEAAVVGAVGRSGTPESLAADEDVRRIYLGTDFRLD